MKNFRKRLPVVILLAMVLCAQIAQADAMIYYNNERSVDYKVQVSAPDGGVNFRYGPGVEYGQIISNMIPNGTILRVTREASASNGGRWGFVSYAGYWGWIALSQVSVYNGSSGGAAPSAGTSSGAAAGSLKRASYEVMVSAPDGGVNLRYGAGVSYDRLMNYMIPNGTSLHIYWEDKASNGVTWGFTSYNGMNGWISLTEVSVTNASSSVSSVRYRVKAAAPEGGINLRSGAGVEYGILLSHMIPNGTIVDISMETRAASNGRFWGYTTYEGMSGWVTLEQVTPVAEVMSGLSGYTGAIEKAPGETGGRILTASISPSGLRAEFIWQLLLVAGVIAAIAGGAGYVLKRKDLKK